MNSKALRMAVVVTALVLLTTQFVVAAEKKAHEGHEQPTAAAAPAAATTAAPAAPMAGHGAGHGGMKMPMMEHRGGMVPAEKKDVFDAIEAKYKPQFAKLHQDAYAKNAELSGALAASAVDEGKVKTLSKELNAINAQLNDLETEKRLEMRKQGVPFGPYMQPHHSKMGGGMMEGKMGGMMGGKTGCPMMQNMQHGAQPAQPTQAPAEEPKK